MAQDGGKIVSLTYRPPLPKYCCIIIIIIVVFISSLQLAYSVKITTWLFYFMQLARRKVCRSIAEMFVVSQRPVSS